MPQETRLPLAWTQYWPWLSQNSVTPPPWMILQIAIELPADTTLERINAAFEHLLRRNEGLRSIFSIGPNREPMWEIGPVERLAFEIVATTAEAAPPARDAIERRLHEPFDLAKEPPVRGALCIVDGTPSTFHLAVHHLVADWGAVQVLRRELLTAVEGPPRPVAAQSGQTTTPAQRVVWEQSSEGRDEDTRARLHWDGVYRRQSYDLPPMRFGPVSGSGYRTRLVSPELAAACKEFSRLQRCSVPAIVMAALGVSLANSRGRDTALLMPIQANRVSRASANYVGMQMSTTWLLMDFSNDAGFATSARQTGASIIQGMRHGKFNGGRLNMDRVADDQNRNFTGAYTFNYIQGIPGSSTRKPGLTVQRYDEVPGDKIQVNAYGDCIDISLTSHDDYLDPDDASSMLAGLPDLLDQVLAEPETPRSALVGVLPYRRPQSARWVDVRGRWIFLPDLEDLLVQMPEVEMARAHLCEWEGLPNQIVCEATLSALVSPAIIFERLRAKPALALTVVIPDVLCLSGPLDDHNSAKGTRVRKRLDTDAHTVELELNPKTGLSASERALLECFEDHHPGTRPHLQFSYAAAGGEFHKIPGMRLGLLEKGFIGLEVWDFTSTQSLRLAAAQLRLVEPNQT